MRDAGLQKIVDEAEQEHRTVKQLVARLESTDTTTSEADRLLSELKADVQHHVREEESEAFPQFRAAVPAEVIESLGEAVEAAKQTHA